MNTLTLPLADISADDRLREIDPSWAELIADSIAEHGQMTPIEVREAPDGERPYALVAGGHRLRAIELLGWADVIATVFDGDAIAARLREIEENLIRNELAVLDKAAFVAEQKSLYEALYPQTMVGNYKRLEQDRQVGDLGASRFTKASAERVGLGERTIQRLVKLHNGLNPAIRRQLTGTWLASNGQQLGYLADIPKSEQPAVVEALFGDTEHGSTRPKTVHQAIDRVRGEVEPPRDPDQEMANRITALWRKASAKSRRLVAQQIHSDIDRIIGRSKS